MPMMIHKKARKRAGLFKLDTALLLTKLMITSAPRDGKVFLLRNDGNHHSPLNSCRSSPTGGIVICRLVHYPESMNLPGFPLSGSLALLIGPNAAQARMLDLAARLAVGGPLRVFDCGNRFNVYPVARAIRSRTADLSQALGRIRLARAFTCYQVMALLEEAADEAVSTLVLDLLATFYDEDVRLPESQRLLRRCLVQLRRLGQAAPVIISARPPKPIVYAERIGLLEALRTAAGTVWEENIKLADFPAEQGPGIQPESPPRLDF